MKPERSNASIISEAIFAMLRTPYLPFAAISNKIVGIYDRPSQEITGPLKAFFAQRPRPWRYYGNNKRRGRRGHRFNVARVDAP